MGFRLKPEATVVLLLTLAACGGVSHGSFAPAPDPRPLLILVSFDGWRWDYDTKAPTPNLQSFVKRGVRGQLIPGYPSKTIPNHYSIVTGLYPGHHGMIANTIYDPSTGRLFRRTDRAEVENPMWWGGEPIWNIAQRSGLNAATMFWPGSEAPVNGMRPRFWREFDERIPGTDRIEQVLAWLDLPPSSQPSFITLYLNDVDTMGHWYGPGSRQVTDAIARTDLQFGLLLAGLERRGLLGRANIVLVSDHGMAATTRAQTIVVDDYLALDDAQIADINPTLGVMPGAATVDRVYQMLARAHPHLRMYRREGTPLHWRFREQPRVPPITGVADEGWVVLRRAAVEEYWKRSSDGGQHGYDPQLMSMRGIFVAAGPAFRSAATVPAFENVHVYNALAMVLGVEAAANDGDRSIARRLLR